MNASRLARQASRSLPRPVHQWVKRRFHAVTKPLVSVVVPVYNVEPYLAECLDSLLQQTYTHLEIVVVDDGSPDHSADIARLYGRRDSRVRLVQQANTGLGGARNTGARHARGELIWFVDSDDAVPPTALMTMYRSLKSSGSDFVVGSLAHWQGDKRTVPDWAARVHAQRRTGITLDDHPEVLKNVFAWTKLFRTEFFREVIREFPHGLYEDQAPSARAYANGTFDVIPEVVCHWRTRADSSSITQQKTSLRDLRERWSAIDATDDALSEASTELRREWQSKVIGFDMRPYYVAMPRATDEYWDELHAHVVQFVERHGNAMFSAIPAVDRMLAVAAFKGHREDVRTLAARREVLTWKVPGRVVAGRAELAPEYFDGLALTPGDVPLGIDNEVDLVHHTDSIVISDSTVTVTGFAYLSKIDTTSAAPIIRVEAVAADGERINAEVRRFDSADADIRALDPWNSHAASGFVATFPVSHLSADQYRFTVSVDLGGCVRVSTLDAPPSYAGGRLPSFGPLTDGARWYAHGKSHLALVRDRAARIVVSALEVTETGVIATLGGSAVHTGRISAVSGNKTIDGSWDTQSHKVTVAIPREWRTGSPAHWRLVWRDRAGSNSAPLAWGCGSSQVPPQTPGALLADVSPTGIVELSVAAHVGEVTDVALKSDHMTVEGWATATTHTQYAEQQVALVDAGNVPLARLKTTWDGPKFSARLPLVDGAGTPWPKGTGFAIAILDGAETHWLRTTRPLASTFPKRLFNDVLAVELTQTPSARATWVRFRAAQRNQDRSRIAQHDLARAYARKHAPLTDTVLFECFGGRSVGDSPLGISLELQRQRPEVEQLWTVDCLTREVPAGTTAVLRYSSEWFDALATSRWLVNNNNWPHFFAKKPSQIYVQTWHGTPLKRIGNDVPQGNLSLTYRALMAREAEQWDYLLAQSPYAADVLPRSLGYAGTTLELGYPRNDSLVAEDANLRRREIRDRLGLTTEYVLLYAPTWRDSVKGNAGYGRISYLDPGAVQRARLGGRSAAVLYRGHSNTAASRASQSNEFIDVTHHSDINELMLAADALVTDYSSIMFDFAATGKPMYFLVPDIAEYGNETRGFYLDLAEVAPGPLCASTDELIRQLHEDYQGTWGARYSAFQSHFAPCDDGHASARVVTTIFGDPDRRVQ